jgi:uncharacterized OB-fold protein
MAPSSPMTLDADAGVRIEKPIPAVDAVSKSFWEACARHQLVAQHCGDCGAYSYPPGITCRVCHGESLTFEPVSGRARLFSYAVLRQPFHAGFAGDLPLVLAMVQLAEDERALMVSNVVDAEIDDVYVGMELEVAFDDRSEVTVPLFRPVRAPVDADALDKERRS